MLAPAELQVVRLTDDELARKTFDTITEVMGREPDLADELFYLVGEMLERWAPDVERREHMISQYEHNRDGADLEIEEHEKALARRARLRESFRRIYADPRLEGGGS